MRQRGEDVFFLTGTDEHGEPVALAAEREGVTPEGARRPQRRALPRPDAAHQRVQRLLHPHLRSAPQAARPGGDPAHPRQRPRLQGPLRGLVLPPLRGLQDRERDRAGQHVPDPPHPAGPRAGGELVLRSPASRSRSRSSTPTSPTSSMPRQRYNEALAFIKGGLNDVSLSRAKLTWGVEVPWDPEHVFYVWFDALLNYYTALSYARRGEDLTERFWPASFHVLGKDILKFHAVFWPAMLMAAGIELPQHVFVHGYLLMDGEKMSKSLGNVLDPFVVMDRFGTDALRFYCFRDVSFGQDGSVSTTQFEQRYESELANDWATSPAARRDDQQLPGRRRARRRARPRAGREFAGAGRRGRARCSTTPSSPRRWTTIAAAFGCPFEGETAPGAGGRDRPPRARRRGRSRSRSPTPSAWASPRRSGTLTRRARVDPRHAAALPFPQHSEHRLRERVDRGRRGRGGARRRPGGFGGCPFAPAATGNIATEDLAYALRRTGIDPGSTWRSSPLWPRCSASSWASRSRAARPRRPLLAAPPARRSSRLPLVSPARLLVRSGASAGEGQVAGVGHGQLVDDGRAARTRRPRPCGRRTGPRGSPRPARRRRRSRGRAAGRGARCGAPRRAGAPAGRCAARTRPRARGSEAARRAAPPRPGTRRRPR